VRDRAAGLHSSYLADRTSIDPNLANPSAVITAWQGRADDWDTFAGRWRQPSDPQEEIRYLYALGQFHSRELVERTLAMLLTDVRTQNAPFLGKYLLENRAGGEAAWAWVKANWDAVVERFPNKSLHRMIEGIRWLARPEVSADVAEFLRSHPVPGEERSIEQSVELLEVTTRFGNEVRPGLGDLLRSL
jgi:aminopeptidase N